MFQRELDAISNGHDFCLGTRLEAPDDMLPGAKGISIIALQSGRTIQQSQSECDDDYRNAHDF